MVKKTRYYKDMITHKPKQFWIVKQIGKDKFKIIYITKEYSERAIGDILDKETTFYDVNGHHTIIEIPKKEAENCWIYDI